MTLCVWKKLTGQLRWFRPYDPLTQTGRALLDKPVPEPRLQQAYIDAEGRVHWEDVPTVHETYEEKRKGGE